VHDLTADKTIVRPDIVGAPLLVKCVLREMFSADHCKIGASPTPRLRNSSWWSSSFCALVTQAFGAKHATILTGCTTLSRHPEPSRRYLENKLGIAAETAGDSHVLLTGMYAINPFGLPEALTRVILVEWLGLKHVVRLDSAMASRQYSLVTYGQFTTFTVNPDRFSSKCAIPLLRWAMSKGVRLDGLRIYDSNFCTQDSLALLDKFLALSGTAIQWIHSYNFTIPFDVAHQDAILLVAKWCPNIVSFVGRCFQPTLQWDECLVTLTKRCRKLTKLSVDGMTVSEQGLVEALLQCVVLEYLELMNKCQAVPVEVAIPSLKSIKCGSHNMRDAVLFAVGQKCAKLETLHMFQFADLEARNQVTDAGLRAVLQGCPLLRETGVQYAVGISTELRVELVRRLSQRTLELAMWPGMDDNLAREMLKVCPDLKGLLCWDCDWITDATLAVCAQHCRQLQWVVLDGSPFVTTDGVRALVLTLGSTLRSVNFRFCNQLGDEVVLTVAEHCPLLEWFHCPPNLSDAAVAKLKQLGVRERCVVLTL
jgi:hypothetical protein